MPRDIPETLLDAIGGSMPDARMAFFAWYGGEAMNDGVPLPVTSWSIDWTGDTGTLMQGTLSITVADGTGDLAPWGFDEALSVGGSEITARFEHGADLVELGTYRNQGSNPNEQWRIDRDGVSFIPGGATVPVTANELTQLIINDAFRSPEAPNTSGTVVSEIKRLCAGIVGVVFTGVTDRAIPLDMTYREDRMATIEDLAKLAGAAFRMTGDGVLEIYATARPAAPHWAILPGAGEILINVARRQDASTIFNSVVATGTNAGHEIREYADAEGILAPNGPMGRKTKFVQSMEIDRDGVLKDARAAITKSGAEATTRLAVSCLPHPGMMIGDWVQIVQPVADDLTSGLVGCIRGMSLSGSGTSFDAMSLTVECDTAEVERIARMVRSARE
ncbi:hypothetical protein ACFY5D_03725 [Paeniglutamicibacter sp. NPDC012692]|uniref:hypothetical protein n=1 Tax=Paeniglutamicibacter sp. NPDC012692 TaxID=3364388 RepID=UPI0036BFBFE4